jgi:hypothetical protein
MFRVTGVTLHSVLMNQDGTASHRKVVRDSRDSRQHTKETSLILRYFTLRLWGGSFSHYTSRLSRKRRRRNELLQPNAIVRHRRGFGHDSIKENRKARVTHTYSVCFSEAGRVKLLVTVSETFSEQ